MCFHHSSTQASPSFLSCLSLSMFVSTRTPTLLALLLLMATLPYLLPAKQSSLVPSLGHQIWPPSIKASNFTTANHPRGLLGDEPTPMPLDAQRCINVSNANPNALTAANQCHAYQVSWLQLLEQKGVHTDDNEYKCKKMYCNSYCDNLVARKYCLPDQYASLHRVLQQQFDAKAQGDCIQWTSWQPRLDAPPAITCENIECQDILSMNEAGDPCVKEVTDKIGTEGKNITDHTELLCKIIFWGEKCAIRQVCKYCTKSANAYLNFVHSIWSPAKVECANWTAAEEPKMQCPTQSSNGSCQSVLAEKGVPEKCANETRVKYSEWDPLNPGVPVELQCKAAFYSYDCGMKAACEQCSDTKDYVEQARKDMDSNEAVCKPWSSEAPKLECPSNILLIVGIVIAVVILVAICVVICCMCFTSSDKSERRSSSRGSRRSKPKGSTRNKAGSSIGAKQTSRAATAGTKKILSRASGGGRPVKKQSRASKGAKPRSRVKQSKRSRASALK